MFPLKVVDVPSTPVVKVPVVFSLPITFPLPVNDRVLEVARGDRGTFLTDARVQGTHLRVITLPYAPGYAVQVARPLTEADHTLDRLRTFLILIALAGIGLAAALEFTIGQALTRWLRNDIVVDGVDVTAQDERVTVEGWSGGEQVGCDG